MINIKRYFVVYKVNEKTYDINLVGSSKKEVKDFFTTFFIKLFNDKKEKIDILSIELIDNDDN